MECSHNRKNASRVCVVDAPFRLALFYEHARFYVIPSVASCARCSSLSQGGINGLELRALKNSIIEKKSPQGGDVLRFYVYLCHVRWRSA